MHAARVVPVTSRTARHGLRERHGVPYRTTARRTGDVEQILPHPVGVARLRELVVAERAPCASTIVTSPTATAKSGKPSADIVTPFQWRGRRAAPRRRASR